MPEVEIGNLLNRLGIVNQDDRILFAQLCQTVSIANDPHVDIDEFIMEIVKWAERHNYASLRLGQTTKRVIQNFCQNLAKLHFCQIKHDNDEIVSLVLTEPQFEVVRLTYKDMESEPDTAFPNDHSINLPLQPNRIIETTYDKISTSFIEENINKDKMIKILFPELNNHIYVIPRLLVQLPSICIRKMGKFFSAHLRLRILDAVIKPMEVMLPDKNLKAERVLKVLNLEDKESPLFFIHFTDGVINRLRKESKVPENIPVLQAALILKQFKLEQNEKEKDEKKEEFAKEDIKKILQIVYGSPKPYSLQELYHLRDDEGYRGMFTGVYERAEFARLIDLFLETYTLKNEQADNVHDMVPEVIKLNDDESRDLFIHREYLISLIERDRLRAKDELRKYFLDRWIHALENYLELPEMKKDSAFEAEVAKVVEKRYKLLLVPFKDPRVYFNIFKIYENDKEIKSKEKLYFRSKDKANLNPYYAIVELNRTELYREAFAALPFVYRFFLSRLIIFFINLFKKKKQQESSGTKSDSASSDNSATDGDSKDQSEVKKAVQANVRKFLPEIEKKYRSGGNLQDIVNELEAKWNMKVGEVRTIVKEKIDKDVTERSTAIYRILLKSPNFSEESLHRELKNMAVDLVQNKYTDILDKKSLARYIMLMAIWILKNKNR